jgi:tellurite resistance protein TerC
MFRKIGSGVGWLAVTTYRQARRVVVLVVGLTVLVIGVIMIVTPGPAILVIPLALSILALEFAWARHLLRKMKDSATAVANRARGAKKEPSIRIERDSGSPTEREVR